MIRTAYAAIKPIKAGIHGEPVVDNDKVKAFRTDTGHFYCIRSDGKEMACDTFNDVDRWIAKL